MTAGSVENGSRVNCRAATGGEADERSILEECYKHVARSRLPEALVFVVEVRSIPSGESDFWWANSRDSG